MAIRNNLLIDDKVDSPVMRLNRSRRRREPELWRMAGDTYALIISGLRFGGMLGYDHSGCCLVWRLKWLCSKVQTFVRLKHDETGKLIRVFCHGAALLVHKGGVFDSPLFIGSLVKPQKRRHAPSTKNQTSENWRPWRDSNSLPAA